jgi:hypothetical protein
LSNQPSETLPDIMAGIISGSYARGIFAMQIPRQSAFLHANRDEFKAANHFRQLHLFISSQHLFA